MSFSLSRFLNFSDDEIVAHYRELQQISVIDNELNLENQSEQVNEIAAAR